MHYGTAYDQSQTASEISESTRTTSQSGSRAQPNLSAEQLRQKRIVNRRAQQAFRERSKENTRRLEQELDSLRVECLSREKELLQETERLREQNEILSQRLRNIASLAMAGPDITHAHTNVHQQREDELSIVSNSASATNSLAVTSQIRLHEMDLQSERNTPAASGLQDQSGAQSDDRPYSARQSASSVAPGIPAVSSLHRRAVASDQECTHSSDTESLPASLTVNSVPESSNLIGNLAMISSHRNPLGLISAVLPVHLSPTCPLDHILLGCLQSNRAALSDGASLKLVAGPERVSVRGFIDAVPDSSAHPISRVMCEVMSTFPSVGKAEQLALFYVMHQTMKWMVFPTEQSYEIMPEWLRPTVAQITVPHAAWIDNIPWPGVRDRIIMYPQDYPYHLWTANFTQAVELRWPHGLSDAWMESDGDIVLHSIFEKFLRRLENWSVSPQFGEVFPDLMPIMSPQHPVRTN